MAASSNIPTSTSQAQTLNDIRSLLTTMANQRGQTIMNVGQALLSSSNYFQYLNPKFYYTIAFYLVGSVTSDVLVHLVPVLAQGNGNAVAFNINGTLNSYRFEGIQLSEIYVDSSTIQSATVYVAWIAYERGISPKVVQ